MAIAKTMVVESENRPDARTMMITNVRGVHARAAAKFVTVASDFDAAIDVTRNGQTVSGRSIMGLMMLAAALIKPSIEPWSTVAYLTFMTIPAFVFTLGLVFFLTMLLVDCLRLTAATSFLAARLVSACSQSREELCQVGK